MANPQPEDGHVDIANQIADKFCSSRISGEEWQVLWVILRKTYGWHKKEDHIGLGQFAEMTGMTRQHSLRALKKLENKKIIAVTKNGNTGVNLYRFIKNFDLWLLLPKKDTVLPFLVEGVTKNGVRVLPKMVHTKETTQKKITKETGCLLIEIPDWIPQDTWSDFMAMRKEKKEPLTEISAKRIIAKLYKLKNLGQSPVEILDESISNGWKGVFPLKQGGNNGTYKGRMGNDSAGSRIPEWRDETPQRTDSDERAARQALARINKQLGSH